MGWSNYVVIPKWKIAFEIRRQVDEDDNYNYWGELIETRKTASEEEFDKKIKDLTIRDVSKLMDVFDKSSFVTWVESDEFLLWFLKANGIEYEIINEFEFKKKKEGYKILSKWSE